MQKDDQVRLRHMLDAAREAVHFAKGRARSDLDGDRMLSLALIKCLEIVGEAAANISNDGRGALPAIPWSSILGMRKPSRSRILRDRPRRSLVHYHGLPSLIDPNP